jgi:hypothetical protein
MKLRSGKIIKHPIQSSLVKNTNENIQNNTNTSFIKEMITFCIISSSILLLTNIFDFEYVFQNISIKDINFSLFSDI